MDKKITFIGCGSMGGAMACGALASGAIKAENVCLCDKHSEKTATIKQKYPVNTTDDCISAAEFADIVFICIEPGQIPALCGVLRPCAANGRIFVSISAGISADSLKKYLGGYPYVLRAMPNMAVKAGAGMSMICANADIARADCDIILKIFQSFGKAVVLPEEKIHAFIALASSSPAFIFMFIEALADAAVYLGMDHDSALECAAQAVYGSAKTVIESGEHPAVLKDAVCTPGGTTVEGVAALENAGFRAAVQAALKATAEKSVKMSKSDEE